MRFWPFAARRHVIRFTVRLVPLVFLAACGGGTGSAEPDSDIQASSEIDVPTTSLNNALTLPDSAQLLGPVGVQQATADSESSLLQLGSAQPITDSDSTDADPTELVALIPSVEPVVSIDTVDAIPSVDPVVSVDPIPSVAVIDSVDTIDPITFVEPAVVTDSVDPISYVEPVVTTDPVDPIPSVDLVASTDPVDPVPSVEPVVSVDTDTSASPAVAIDPVEPNERSFNIGTNAGDVIKLISDLEVSTAQTNVQQTPIATADGYLYTANIEHGPRGDARGYDLKTVIRQGFQEENGDWNWQTKVVEDRTINDKWHTAPSIEVDKAGLVHVVYNLHNFPWQYKRSTEPHDLNSFEFRGQAVSDEEIRLSTEENRTSFPTTGKADIPGNQVTYPAFFKDQNQDLYLSYRFAATPKQSFSNRTMSSGVSVYNSTTKSWQAIGGQVPLSSADYEQNADASNESIAIAAKRGWTNYHPRLAFDQDNNMFVSWFWRSGTAGAIITRPCLVSTADRSSFFDTSGNSVTLPMEPDQCSNLGYPDSQGFYSIGNTAINNAGEVHILLSPDDTGRKIVHYDKASGEWRRMDSPYNASEIFFDADDTMWAIASGIRIFKRTKGSSNWQSVYDDSSGDNCYPRARMTEDKKFAFIHAEDCDYGAVSVFGLRLK